MRLRHIRGAEEAIETSPFVIQEPKEHRGHFCELFGNTNPIQIEVGMGKGKFIMELALKHPETNFIGIERYSSVLLRALQKREELFAPGEVEKIYLNFSDPWPKDRHAKRRLTSPDFMKVYDQVLAKDGRVEFKTDNQDLFTYSLEAIPEAGWTIEASTRDLHHSDMAEGNVVTEYETKFSAMGNPICKRVASR